VEKLKHLYDLGIDVDNGVIPLIGTVDELMYAHLVNSLTQLSNAKKSYEQLTIILNTYGGELYHAFAIYDLLRMQEMSIRIVCNGPVMSAGTIILMAGDVREMTPLSYLMIHYGFDMQESHSGLKQNSDLLDLMKKLYKDNSDASTKTIEGWFDADKYFTASAALKMGLIDKVQKYEQQTKRKKKRATRARKRS
jgi:ATP-dependent protease ClpP protease subunit